MVTQSNNRRFCNIYLPLRSPLSASDSFYFQVFQRKFELPGRVRHQPRRERSPLPLLLPQRRLSPGHFRAYLREQLLMLLNVGIVLLLLVLMLLGFVLLKSPHTFPEVIECLLEFC